MPQRLDMKLWQALQRLARLARREDQRDLLGQQAPSHERKDACRCPVEPLRVVDHTEERSLPGGLGQQAEDRQSDEEGVRACPVLSPRATAAPRAEDPGGAR